MGSLVVILLLGLWASILLPGLIRARRQATPLNSVTTFERCMSMLAPTAAGRNPGQLPGRHVLVLRDPVAVATDSRRSRVLRRRRSLLLRLLGGTAATATAAVLVGGLVWWVFGLVAASLVAYVGLLVHVRQRELELRRKVMRLTRHRRDMAAATSSRAAAERPAAVGQYAPASSVLVRHFPD